ncbi:MAG: GAF domain-containing protein, partial [Chloroflexota bacterium]|nr:GAF domain-containing protein [Chloroflexota bacterium]
MGALEEKVEKKAFLEKMDRALASTLDLEEVFQLIIQTLRELFKVEAGSLALIEDGQLVFKAALKSEELETLRRFRLKLGQGVAGCVAEEGVPLLVSEARQDPKFYSKVDKATDFVTKSILCAPLKVKKTIGVIEVLNKVEGDFTEDDLKVLTAVAERAALAIENARLYEAVQKELAERKRAEEALRRRNEQLAAFNAIAAVVSQSLDLDQILAGALDKALEVLELDAGAIRLVDEEREELVLAVCSGMPKEMTQWIAGTPIKEGVAGRVVQTGKVEVGDFADYGAAWPEMVDRYGRKQFPFTCIPLKARDKVIGVMTIANTEPRQFTTQDVQLLTAIGNQISVAIENARLFEEERRRATQLALISEVGEKAASILDLDGLMQEVPRSIQEKFNYYNVALFLLDEERREVVMQAVVGGFEHIAPGQYRQSLDEGIIGFVARTGKSWLANDVSKDPHYVKGFLEEVLTKSELCIPIKLGDKVIGALDVQSIHLNDFNQAEVMAMEAVADRLAIAIENARLFDETKQRAESLSALYQIGKEISAALELDRILDTLCDEAMRATDVAIADVALVDLEQGTWEMKAVRGFTEDLKGVERSLDVGIHGRVARTGESAIIPDVSQTEDYLLGDPQVRSELAVPILLEGKMVGVANVESTELSAFDEDDLRFVQALADQAAIAIKNARLYEETKRRLEELSFLHQAALAATSTLDFDEMLRRTIDELHDTIGFGRFGYLFIDEDAQELKLHPTYYGLPADAVERIRVPLGKGVTGWVAQTGEPMLVPDVREEPRYIVFDPEVRSEMCAPLKVGGKVIGVLNVESPKLNAFSEDNLRLLSTLAGQLAMVIENARLFDELRRSLRELKQT